MSTSTLHITNSDKTTSYLKSMGYVGEFITWREMLCEGKTSIDVGSETFWKTRFEFLKSSYKVTKKTFIDFTLKEYRNLCQNKNKEEIILWFDHNLHSQINMIAIVSWLKRYRKGEKISLVIGGTLELSNKIETLNQLSKNQITEQYLHRSELSLDDIEYADYIWQLYCSNCPLRLETIYKYNPMSPFIHLSKAIEMHLKRFPSIENGLNSTENYIIKTAAETMYASKNELVKNLLKNEETYGFKEYHYTHKIERIKILFTSLNPVKLRTKGKTALKNEEKVTKVLRTENAYLGGVKQYSYLYQNNSNKLLKISI